MKNAQRSDAARMITRALELGLTTKTGSPVVIDLMEELVAAAAGYRNAHAWRAALTTRSKMPRPALEQVAPEEDGADYRLVHGRGAWIDVGGFTAHVFLEPDNSAVTVNLHDKADTFEPLASATAQNDQLKPATDEPSQDGVERDVDFAGTNRVFIGTEMFNSMEPWFLMVPDPDNQYAFVRERELDDEEIEFIKKDGVVVEANVLYPGPAIPDVVANEEGVFAGMLDWLHNDAQLSTCAANRFALFSEDVGRHATTSCTLTVRLPKNITIR